jgi:hypothetical protein
MRCASWISGHRSVVKGGITLDARADLVKEISLLLGPLVRTDQIVVLRTVQTLMGLHIGSKLDKTEES